MVEVPQRRLMTADSRRAGRHLRVTWHSGSSTMVFSHWDGAVCTASTPVSLHDTPELAQLIIGALADEVSAPASAPNPVRPQATGWDWFRERGRRRWTEVVEATEALLDRRLRPAKPEVSQAPASSGRAGPGPLRRAG